MMAAPVRKTREKVTFGDFQTPPSLSAAVCEQLARTGCAPDLVLEPTCGKGAFLKAAAEVFTNAQLIGVDINPEHLAVARKQLDEELANGRGELLAGDFFKFDWSTLLDRSHKNLLILGNPPWVTSAGLGALASTNLPQKSNFDGRNGLDALTGKSNFDISEWMLLRYLEWLDGHAGWIAVLVKTAVARKILMHAWKAQYPLRSAAIYLIDAMEHFGAAVDACLFVLRIEPGVITTGCSVFEGIDDHASARKIGIHDGAVISNVDDYLRWQHLSGADQHYVWRSGIKHDCSKVMELTAENGQLTNGFGEAVNIENLLLFPMLKSSDVSNNVIDRRRFMLVTQIHTGQETSHIQYAAPQTWDYLQQHADVLRNRGSSIYRNRPPFSIFGVGDYSFADWKVAISGFYKKLAFNVFGPIDGRPPVFDDTVYFLPCQSQQEAEFISSLLNSQPAQEFYESMVFWSDKRPITSELLRRLDLAALATELGAREQYESFIRNERQVAEQLAMF